MNVRERVMQGKNVRVRPLAEAIGVPPSTIYAWIADGKLEATKFERTVLIPARAAERLLGVGAAS